MSPKNFSLIAATVLALVWAGAPAAAQGLSGDSLITRANESRTKGVAGAPITIVEISDFQCPFCRQFSERTLAALDSAYIRTGKARLVFYNIPLPSHPAAWSAAEAALCAGAQGRFWPMHDRLFADQARWSAAPTPAEHFDAYAAALGLDAASFRECTQNDRVAPLLITDVMQAARGGVSATPTFVVVREPKEGENPELAQRVLSGFQPLAEFTRVIEELTR